MILVSFLCHLINFQQYVCSFTVTASTFYISFIAEKCLYTRRARPNQSRIFAFVSVGKNKNKNALNQKLIILKCPFVPRWPRNSFFSGNYSSEEEESYNDHAYQAYTQNSLLWIVLFQYSVCQLLPQNLNSKSEHLNTLSNRHVFIQTINKFLDLFIVSKILRPN